MATKIRKSFVMSVLPSDVEEYVRRHNPIWPELAVLLRRHGVHNYSIHLDPDTLQLFAYVEIESEDQWAELAQQALCREWWAYMRPLMPCNPDNSPVTTLLREVFHLE